MHCFLCQKPHDPNILQTLCSCGRPLRVDLALSADTLDRETLRDRPATMWRYREVLPRCGEVSLGEGWTPMHRFRKHWWIKDEGLNPTASFKARGMSAAVSMARHFGVRKLAVPSAGNAASALSAYAAAAGLEAHVFMPADTPNACIVECRVLGAHVTLIEGLITDCAAEIGLRKDDEGWFDLSTLKEPYRIEGKKTMGYEIAEQLGWRLPDAILYPTGGGTGLIGMHKAFDEMERMGWIDSRRPKMISVQAEGCALLPPAFQAGERFGTPVEGAHTVASGLRVPKAIGDFIMLDLIRETGGIALAVSDATLLDAAQRLSAETGVFACPEGGATLAAAEQLVANGFLKEEEEVVLFNTGSGLKYLEAW